jgi:hypothetical protein
MADANPIQPYSYPPSQADEFDRLGHPGKWRKSLLPSGTAWFTGSNYGVGAVLPVTSAAGTAYLTDGGTIDLSKLVVGHIHELSVEHVEGASNVYVLFRNQVIR